MFTMKISSYLSLGFFPFLLIDYYCQLSLVWSTCHSFILLNANLLPSFSRFPFYPSFFPASCFFILKIFVLTIVIGITLDNFLKLLFFYFFCSLFFLFLGVLYFLGIFETILVFLYFIIFLR